MSKSTLSCFWVNDHSYEHYIDTETDATHVINENSEIIYTVDSDCHVYDRAGRIGKFYSRRISHKWYFEGLSGVVFESHVEDLIAAEVKLFKHFLEN
jgi:hypothetical protein